MPHIYLAHWEWFSEDGFDYWRSPNVTARGVLDLRSLPQMGKAGGAPEGAGLFVYDTPQSSPLILADLGTDIEANLKTSQKRELKRAIGVSPSTPIEDKPRTIIRQFFLDPNYYDPTGQTRLKPFRIPTRGKPTFRLGGFGNGVLFTEPRGSLLEDSTLAVFRSDYIRNREWVNQVTGQEAEKRLDVLRRVTASEMRKIYGRMDDSLAQAILPDPYKGDGWRVPKTTITESFNTADSDTLGPDLSWTELDSGDWDIVTNAAQLATTSFQPARADTDLSSDDHYSQATILVLDGTRSGVMCRKDSGATLTYYMAYCSGTNSPDVWAQFKRIAGSFTNIGSNTDLNGSDNDVIKIEANGSTIKRFRNGSEQDSATDTAVTGNLRCGLEGRSSSSIKTRMDVFEAADLAAGGQTLFPGLATETDTAFAITPVKTYPVGLASEADSALAVTTLRQVAVGLAAEADTGLAVGYTRTLTVGLAQETDTAFTVSTLKERLVGLASELDTALGVGASRSFGVGLAGETDTAFAIGRLKEKIVGLATEIDTALAIIQGRIIVVGLASETDTGLGVTRSRAYTVGLATEVDSALGVTRVRAYPVGLASETDSALGVGHTRAVAVGLAQENDVALAVSRLKERAMGLASEADSALAAIVDRGYPVGLASETDTALAIGRLRAYAVGLALETDTALAITAAGGAVILILVTGDVYLVDTVTGNVHQVATKADDVYVVEDLAKDTNL